MAGRYHNTPEIFWRNVARRGPDDCWEWLGYCNPYGVTCFKGLLWKAHRLAFFLTTPDWIPDPVVKVLHRCDNPPCCNPTHLFLGTQADNVRDMAAKGRDNRVKGAAHGGAKLTEEQVRLIRASSATTVALAAVYGVSHSLISHIRTRRSWTHVLD